MTYMRLWKRWMLLRRYINARHMTKEEWYRKLFEGLGASKFRSSFHLKQKEIDYINEKGMDVIMTWVEREMER